MRTIGLALAVFGISAFFSAGRSFAGQVLGSVVTSREWHVRRSPRRQEEFIGDVRYRSGGDDVRADWALFDHPSRQWRARGHVSVEHALSSGEVFSGRGETASFNQRTVSGRLGGPGGVDAERRVPGERPDRAHAGELEWRGREQAELTGGVHLWGPRLEAWADRADYSGAEGTLTLAGGRPVLRKLESAGGAWTGAIKADRIEAWRESSRLSAQGRARGWLVLPGSTPGLPGAARR